MAQKAIPAAGLGGPPRPPKVLGISKPWEYFLLSVMLALLLPLLPLPIEYFSTHEIKPESLTLAVAIYAVSIGVTSRSQVIFGVGLIAGILFAVEYGVAIKTPTDSPSPSVCWAVIGFIFASHAIERYQRHVQQRSPFLEFA